MKKRKKQEFRAKRKNYTLTLIVTILFWILLVTLIFLTEPAPILIILFFITVFLACFFPLSIVFANRQRGLIYAGGILLFILLAYLGVGNILNAIFITASAISLDIYLKTRN